MKRKRISTVLPSVLLLTLATHSADAQSMWARRHTGKAFMFYDTQARQVGDLLTVIIRENTDVENSDSRALDRDVKSSGGFDFVGAVSGDFGSKAGDIGFDTSTKGSGTFDGKSEYNVERGFSDRITVVVVSRLPNGNLVIRGKRDRIVSGEIRTLTVSGVVRSVDISADNTIESRYIADFSVCYTGEGIESRFNKQGWITRAWNKFRPL